MRILLVKTSSLGDIVHTYPALTDAQKAIPGIRFDWLVEEAFAELPLLHPAVDKVKTIALRRWRKGWRKAYKNGHLRNFVQALRADQYDLVIDAQGLIAKSAIPAAIARGKVVGFDYGSAREKLSSVFYHRKVQVSRGLHAIERIRRLFAAALSYSFDENSLDYGVRPGVAETQAAVMFLHATTWESKHWPVNYWVDLVRLASDAGMTAKLPWASEPERERAEQIVAEAGVGEVLPKLSLDGIVREIAAVSAVVGVDSGLTHLAAALDKPVVALYGPTNSHLTGISGSRVANLQAEFDCSPCMKKHCLYPDRSDVSPACFEAMSAALVWRRLQVLAALKDREVAGE